MRALRGTYTYFSDRERRHRQWRRAIVAVASCGAVLIVWAGHRPREARADVEPTPLLVIGSSELRDRLDAVQGQLDLANSQLERMHAVFEYSSRYKISADLAASIYDVSQAEGIEPDLAFRLVNVESQFNERAKSSVGAIGLTQVMPSTARYFVPDITRDGLYDRETNLRCGFRYLRSLVRETHGNMKTALLIYNRGEQAVNLSRQLGLDPSNGYERIVLRGYNGKGVTN
jgi:soluble lytic murein transglycosylase-like protein